MIWHWNQAGLYWESRNGGWRLLPTASGSVILDRWVPERIKRKGPGGYWVRLNACADLDEARVKAETLQAAIDARTAAA